MTRIQKIIVEIGPMLMPMGKVITKFATSCGDKLKMWALLRLKCQPIPGIPIAGIQIEDVLSLKNTSLFSTPLDLLSALARLINTKTCSLHTSEA